jgi:hypothetical protein
MILKTLQSASATLAFSLAFSLPTIAQSGQVSSGPPPVIQGENEALKMVPAQVALLHTLDAAKLQTGAIFQAQLVQKIHLSDGTILPSGTILLGEIAQDDMNVAGNSRLALRFTQARIKNGQDIPIRATIVDVQSPADMDTSGHVVTPGQQEPNLWTPQTLQVNQIDVTPGVDLHSSIASHNSGVFATTKKKDVQLRSGTELSLAIAPAGQSAQTTGTSGQ